jgi:hypothetical protein
MSNDDALSRAKRALQVVPQRAGALAPVDKSKVNNLLARAREASRERPPAPVISKPVPARVDPPRQVVNQPLPVPVQVEPLPVPAPAPEPERVVVKEVVKETVVQQVVQQTIVVGGWGPWTPYYYGPLVPCRRFNCPLRHGFPCNACGVF